MAWTFYTDEQKALAESYRQAAREHVKPLVRKVDEDDRLPQELLKKLVEPPFSLTGLSVPRKFGGLEMGKLEVCIIAEEMGYALTDEGAGSDPLAMKTTATLEGDGFVLRGKKRLITFADLADLMAVFAYEDKSAGAKGISAFIIDTKTPGVKLLKHCKTLGLKGHRAWDVELDGVRVPKNNRIGQKGDGLKLAFKALNNTRISLSFGYVGLARAALELAIEHAKTRQVAGKPIGVHQAISFLIAETAAEVDAARLLSLRAAVLAGQTERHRKETSMAKFYAADALIKAVDTANRVLGGSGSDPDLDAERYLRDAYSWISAQGTPEVQKITASRELLGF
jgi:alkylation response protein AidB-like acyl-CoA dehydrogenase